MNEKLQASTSSYEAALFDSSRANSASDITVNCCKLFLNCFKITRKKQLLEEMIDNDIKEYEHVVEKLVVKRIPFVLISVPKNPLQCKNDSKVTSNSNKNVLRSLTKLNTMHSTSSEAQSLLYSDKFDQQMVSLDTINKCLHFNKNRIVLTERSKKCTLSNDHYAKLTELMNNMSSLHTDLEKHEEPPKDSCPLNIPRNFGRIDSSETKSKIDQKISALNQLKHVNLNDFQSHPTSNLQNSTIQSIQEMSCININQTNAEDCAEINRDQQVLINESNALSKNIANIDLSNLILRWNIIVKHYKCKTLSFEIPQKMSKYFNIS